MYTGSLERREIPPQIIIAASRKAGIVDMLTFHMAVYIESVLPEYEG